MTERFQTAADRPGLIGCLQSCGLQLRWNLRSKDVEIAASSADAEALTGWQAFDDLAESALRERIAETCMTDSGKPWRLPTGRWHETVQAICADRTVDPFRAWLQDRHEDGGDAARLLTDRFAVEDEQVAEYAAMSLLVGIVARTLTPGADHQQMVILSGPQGCGKSLTLRHLLPDRGLFTDSLDFRMDLRTLAETLEGTALAEASEIAGLGKADAAKVKQTLSASSDRYRAPYARRAQHHPRMSVIAGSHNPAAGGSLPNDPSGFRRFVVVHITAPADRLIHFDGSLMAAQAIDDLVEQRKAVFADTIRRLNLPADHKDRWPYDPDPDLADRLNAANEIARQANETLEETLAQIMPTQQTWTMRDLQSKVRQDSALTERESTQPAITAALPHIGNGWYKTREAGTGRRLILQRKQT